MAITVGTHFESDAALLGYEKAVDMSWLSEESDAGFSVLNISDHHYRDMTKGSIVQRVQDLAIKKRTEQGMLPSKEPMHRACIYSIMMSLWEKSVDESDMEFRQARCSKTYNKMKPIVYCYEGSTYQVSGPVYEWCIKFLEGDMGYITEEAKGQKKGNAKSGHLTVFKITDKYMEIREEVSAMKLSLPPRKRGHRLKIHGVFVDVSDYLKRMSKAIRSEATKERTLKRKSTAAGREFANVSPDSRAFRDRKDSLRAARQAVQDCQDKQAALKHNYNSLYKLKESGKTGELVGKTLEQCSRYEEVCKGRVKLAGKSYPAYGMFRVFPRGLDTGGRYYMPLVQNLPSEVRAQLVIDGEVCIELDYKSMGPQTMYALLLKKPVPNGDAYHIPDLVADCETEEDCAKVRIMVKRFFSVILTSGVAALKRSYPWFSRLAVKDYYKSVGYDSGYVWIDTDSCKRVMNECIAYHQDIISRMEGICVMSIDSKVAEKIITKFTDADEVVLPVHDSFIVKESLEPLLRQSMIEAFQEVTGSGITPVIHSDH